MKDNLNNTGNENIKTENIKEHSKEALQSLKKDYYKADMSETQFNRLKLVMEQAKKDNKRARKRKLVRNIIGAVAAVAIIFVAMPNTTSSIAEAMERIPVIGQLVKVVTFREYNYGDSTHLAEVEVPEVTIDSGDNSNSDENQNVADDSISNELQKSTSEVNEEIKEITNKLVNEFNEHMRNELGFKEIAVKSKVLLTAQYYFTLKLSCYQAEASGYECDYYYTINLLTGEKMNLQDVFEDNADYITPVSENIKEQMRARMAKDDSQVYWLEDEIDDVNFESITEDTSFYINADNNVVICFNEGEVAPMYMGSVEFEIPENVVKDIRKY